MTTKSAFASLITHLPKPHAVYITPQARFEVYRAHALGGKKWESQVLKKITEVARSSYDRYGRRPRFDSYDEKSAIYLVRVITPLSHSTTREEWLSIRMVPGNGKPLGVNEPEMFQWNGRPVHYWMQKRVQLKKFWNSVASSSRMCGIHPYQRSRSGAITFEHNPEHRYTPLCFALIHEQFVRDYPLSKFPYRYITAMIRSDFHHKGLSLRVGRRTMVPHFTAVHQFLKVPKTAAIAPDRAIYSYAFPLYWFDIQKLRELTNDLRKKIGKPPLRELRPEMFRALPKNSKRPLAIAGVTMRPGDMRHLIDLHVPDAPQLKITSADEWYAALRTMLHAAKMRPVKAA